MADPHPARDDLAQTIADHFCPPYVAEDFVYVKDENGKRVRDPETGFAQIEYVKRPFRESIDGDTMVTKRWLDEDDAHQISIVPLTWREVADAVLQYYDIVPRETEQ